MKNVSSIALLGLLIVAVNSAFADELCTFTTKKAHYAALTSLDEPMSFKWIKSTGQVTGFNWLNGPAATRWFQYVPDPGKVVDLAYPGDYHYLVDMGVTTAGFTTTRYHIRGIVQESWLPDFKDGSNATFAGIFEGSSSRWFVAYGKLYCKALL